MGFLFLSVIPCYTMILQNILKCHSYMIYETTEQVKRSSIVWYHFVDFDIQPINFYNKVTSLQNV